MSIRKSPAIGSGVNAYLNGETENPAALIVSAAMLLDCKGRRSGENVLVEAAAAAERAVDDLLAVPETRTPDLDGALGTRAFGDALAARIGDA